MTPPKKGFSALRQGAWWVKNAVTKALPRPVPKVDSDRHDRIRRHARKDDLSAGKKGTSES